MSGDVQQNSVTPDAGAPTPRLIGVTNVRGRAGAGAAYVLNERTSCRARLGGVLLAFLGLVAGPFATAQNTVSKTEEKKQPTPIEADVLSCTRPLGTIVVGNGDDPARWRQYQLGSPEKLIEVLIRRSGCFRVIDRGAGLSAAERERGIGRKLGPVRDSNIGKGQVKAADYVLSAQIQGLNGGAKGIGSAVSGIGRLTGGIRIKKVEADTLLSLTNVRTTLTIAEVEGYATRNDLVAGADAKGFLKRGVTAVGGGYDDTDIGRVVTLSFIQAYNKMVTELGLTQPGAVDLDPTRVFITGDRLALRVDANGRARRLRTLPSGSVLYPTGNKRGLYWEVADDKDHVGWIRNPRTNPDPAPATESGSLTNMGKRFRLLTPGAAAAGAMGARAASGVELRQYASADSPVVKIVPIGTPLTPTGNRKPGWVEVADPAGARGWIRDGARK